MSAPVYELRAAPALPASAEDWAAAAEGRIADWHPRSGPVRPDVRFRALFADGCIAVRFDVRGDRGVRSVETAPQGRVWTDSCVEFFVRPEGAAGHINLEVNAGGALRASYVLDPRRTPDGGFAAWTLLPPGRLARIRVRTSLPPVVDPPLAGPADWSAELAVPLDLLAELSGAPCRPRPGDAWRGNFYHCGDETPFPRWGAWSGVGTVLDFHQPSRFGTLRFA